MNNAMTPSEIEGMKEGLTLAASYIRNARMIVRNWKNYSSGTGDVETSILLVSAMSQIGDALKTIEGVRDDCSKP